VSRVRYELGFYIPEDGIFHRHRHEKPQILQCLCLLELRIPVTLSPKSAFRSPPEAVQFGYFSFHNSVRQILSSLSRFNFRDDVSSLHILIHVMFALGIVTICEAHHSGGAIYEMNCSARSNAAVVGAGSNRCMGIRARPFAGPIQRPEILPTAYKLRGL
jgi:hypothetical protein